MRSPTNELSVGQALALGALQGPTELLPVSSSAHTTALAWLMGWGLDELDPDLRKSFEVALHGGGTLALLLVAPHQLTQSPRELDRQRLRVVVAASVPPAAAGVVLERVIARRLGTPRRIAVALLAGSVLMAAADRFPQERESRAADTSDGLWLGLAQALALVPGVSRAGATLAVARILRFRATDAKLLSDQVALPVLVGAVLLRALELRRRGLDAHTAARFAAGGGAAFASTLLLASRSADRRTAAHLLPYAVYRTVLAAWILIRLRRG